MSETRPPPALEDLLPGRSETFQAFREGLRSAAPSEATVLIVGESGSGKTSAARALHAIGPRAAEPLVEVQLAALAPSLLEAELFGHEAGAFTGAERARRGRFRLAGQGTLVLEGVELVPAPLQVKLLRVLQERRFEPLGSEESVPVGARVVATSTRDLRAEVDEGRFRRDLYYRLAVMTLYVPPLRSRPDDIVLLAESLARRVAQRAGVPPRELAREARHRLTTHSWPGNVRELENALERLSVLVPGGGPVEAAELDFLFEAVEGAARRLAREALAHGLDMRALTLAMMEEAIAEERGNLSAAARRVGLSRRAFEYRLHKLKSDET